MATKRMDESWQRVRHQIEGMWSDVDFDDKEMKRARGSLPRMIDLVHHKTGEPRNNIRQKIMATL